MKTLMTALAATSLLATTPALAQGWQHGGGMGGAMHGIMNGGGFGGHSFHGNGNGHGFGSFRFNQRHTFRDFDHWRRRGRGNACRIMGYGYGCVSIADVPYLIFSLNDEIYCYDREYGRPRAIECPYDDWYDY